MSAATVNEDIPTLDGLGLPRTILELALEAVLRMRGLILVAGARGSGTSSTVAAMLGFLNRRTFAHIVTFEEDMRYRHRPDTCIVSQCGLSPVRDFRLATLRAVRNWSADLVVIDCPRDVDALTSAVEIAAAGSAVIATVEARTASHAFMEVRARCAATAGAQFADLLVDALRMITSQRLVPRDDGTGAVPAMEVVQIDRTIADLLFQRKFDSTREIVKRSRAQGMQTLEQALCDLHAAGTISLEEAVRSSDSIDDILRLNKYARPVTERTPRAVFSALLETYGTPRIVAHNGSTRWASRDASVEDPFGEGVVYYQDPFGEERFISIGKYVEVDADDIPVARAALTRMGIVEVLHGGIRRGPDGNVTRVVRTAVREDVAALNAGEMDDALKQRRVLDVGVESTSFGHSYIRFSVVTHGPTQYAGQLHLLFVFDSPCCLADEEVALAAAYDSWKSALTVLDEFRECFTRRMPSRDDDTPPAR